MFLEIVTPEGILFEGDVLRVKLPGVSGEFQLLENHAPIVSSLTKGLIIIETKGLSTNVLDTLAKDFKKLDDQAKKFSLAISFGTLEMNANKATVLVG